MPKLLILGSCQQESIFKLIRHIYFIGSFLIITCLFIGCEGDLGPVGPAGPPGSPGEVENMIVKFIGPHPVIRADGFSTLKLTAKVMISNENELVGMPVTFTIVSGDGTIFPREVDTDLLGEASCIYTSGMQSGEVVLSASINYAGLTISCSDIIYLDSLNISEPLLTKNFAQPLRAKWSSDGSSIIFEMEDSYDFRLFKVSAQGGTAEYFGAYRGGVWNPDGSERIVAYSSNSDIYVLDKTGNIIEGPLFPGGFFYTNGEVRDVSWCYDGERVVGGGSTNALIGVVDLTSGDSKKFGAVWVNSISPIIGTTQIIVTGRRYDSDVSRVNGISLIDLETESSIPLLISYDSYYSEDYDDIDIRGASCNPTGINVVFSARPSTMEGVEDQHDLYIIPTDGGSEEEILKSPVDELYPEWSPDGTKILFCSDRSGNGYNLYVLALEGV